jgi:hypothetical protein
MMTAAAGAQASTLAALTGDRTLLIIDTSKSAVLRQVNVKGIGGRQIVGIDVRTADSQLYGLLADGSVVKINVKNGAASPKSKLAQTLPAGVQPAVDFNPAADRLRLIGSDGTNLAANVDDGSVVAGTNLSFAQPNPFGGVTPRVVAGAYTNNFVGTKGTLLLGLDDTTDAIYAQVPPAGGVLNAIASPFGFDLGPVAFDIETDKNRNNRGWLLKGKQLSQVSLLAGLTRNPRTVKGLNSVVRDIAVLPAS